MIYIAMNTLTHVNNVQIINESLIDRLQNINFIIAYKFMHIQDNINEI